MADVRVRLCGGPEDGTEVSVDADAAGRPVPRITVPARSATRARSASGDPPMLIYERQRARQDGTWEFRYVGVEFA